MATKYKLQLKDLIRFFDYKPDCSHRHSNSLVALFGEQLAFQMIKHYFVNVKKDEVIEMYPRCGPGTKKGRRLDGWVIVKSDEAKDKFICYQTEIKNVSSHSFRWEPLRINAINPTKKEIENLEKESKKRFDKFLPYPENEGIWKVLNKMKLPVEFEYSDTETRPLLCVWDAMHYQEKIDPFFEYPFSEKFKENLIDKNLKEFKDSCYIFSMSNYARELLGNGTEEIDIELEDVRERLDWIHRIIGNPIL